MGDPNRFVVMAEWVLKQFPKCKTVYDVAGGGGVLAAYLSALGYEVTIVDPKGRLNPEAKAICRKSRRMPRIIRKALPLPDLPRADLLIGLHPDEATVPIVEQADAWGAHFAVVPCCIKKPVPLQFVRFKKNPANWAKYLARLPKNLDTKVGKLRIGGRNRVVWGWPKKTNG